MWRSVMRFLLFFFFNDTATTEIYTLSLHDALPICQTDESARSPSQCETRERILAGAVLGMAGPGNKIAGIMPCTVIAAGDMADRILDREKHPDWNGTRTKMVYAFPKAEKLWEEY